MTLDARIAEFKVNNPDFGWLIRTDEKKGFFVHLHRGPIKNEAGGLLGFENSYMEWNSSLDTAWDICLYKLRIDHKGELA